ncbi:MAG: efflux RND transporter periplasmic adaptor subunit [Dehalobacterium sp.]
MKKKYLKPVLISLAVLIGVSAVYFFFFAGKSKEVTTSSLEVTHKVSKGSIVKNASGTGNISSSVRKEIKALDSGIVDQIFVEEGQFVQAGDQILTFQNEQADSKIASAQLSLEIQQNKLSELKNDLQELKVYATASGTITELDSEEGQELSKGFSLATIKDTKNLEIVALFNAAQIKGIKVGDKAVVTMIDSFAQINGKVTKKRSTPTESDDGTVAYEVTVTVSNPGGLAAGMDGQVTVTSSQGSFEAVATAEFQGVSGQKISLKTGGTLKKLYVSDGDYVNKGDLLAELESTSLQNEIKTQELQREQSQLSLQEQLESIDDTVVYAPISGVISQVDVTTGERVSENSTVAVVSDLQALEVVIPVDELDINSIQLGMEAAVTVNSVPDMKYEAVVSDIAHEGTVSSGVASYDVTLTLQDIEGLKPGMSATGEIIINQKDQVLYLPVEAVQQRGNQKFVMVRKDGKNEPVNVKVGLVTDNMAEITEGLNEGDEVVYTVSSSGNSQRFGGGSMMMGAPPGGGGGGVRVQRN